MRRTNYQGTGGNFSSMDIFFVVMVLWFYIYIYVKDNQIVHFKHVQFICQLYFNKAIFKKYGVHRRANIWCGWSGKQKGVTKEPFMQTNIYL